MDVLQLHTVLALPTLDDPPPQATQGGAPAGRFFTEAELPVQSHSGAGMPMTTSGFRPTDATAPLPEPGSSTGFPLPPKR